MAMELAYKLLTVEEFLDVCPNDQRHYQLIDGVIVAMAPPAIPHQIIAANLTIDIVSSKIVRGDVEASRWVIKLNRPSFMSSALGYA